MEKSDKQEQRKNQFTDIKTFPVSFALEEIKENISIFTNTPSKPSKEEIINQAFKFHSQGNISEAAKYYQYLINQGFNDHRIFSNYGIILKSLGKLKEAELSTQKAIEIKPDFAEMHSNLGNILRDLDKLKEAEISLRKAIEIKPNYAEAYYNLGNILKDLGKLKEAEISYRKAIEIKPDYAKAHYNLGNLLKDNGKLKEAELSYLKAIGIKPDYAKAHSNLGNLLRELGNLQEAEMSYRKAIELNPTFAEAHYNLGNLLKELGNLQEAEMSYRKAIEIKPDYAEAHSNLGNLLRELGNLQEAEMSYRKAIEIKPDYAEAFWNLSLVELLQGDYINGLENYEFRFKKKKPTITQCITKLKRIEHKKLQKGEKLLVVTEQGLGDTLQYMRYIPYLRNQGLNISFCAQTKLHSLIQASGIDQNPLTPEQAETISDGKWIPLLSLPRYLQVRQKNPIISKPYIFSTDELTKKWRDILSEEKRPIIGINWQGNPNVEKEELKGRSLALETFATLARNNNFKFLSLQKGFGSEQLEKCSFRNKFVNCQAQIDETWDFLENAAIIENCDLIITSDTSIAHLAGGLGKSTWLLLQHIPEWRWGLERENTFWYPSMRLFRQKERHNWQEVMERVSSKLKKKLEEQI